MNHLITIAGPTASGKTALAIRIARQFETEIINADSRQFFTGLDIGTAKPTKEQLAEVKHHFIDILDVEQDYNISKFEADVLSTLDGIFKHTNKAILTGGSGLYIQAVCTGLDKLPERDPEIRKILEEDLATKGIKSLREKLRSMDPDYYQKADLNNPRRLLRALEVCLITGSPYSSFLAHNRPARNFRNIVIGLDPGRTELYNRINLRVDQMMQSGFLEEANRFIRFRGANALQTVGYKELFSYLDGKLTLDEAVNLVKQNSRRYAKRQMTWFRKMNGIVWFHPEDENKITEYIRAELENSEKQS